MQKAEWSMKGVVCRLLAVMVLVMAGCVALAWALTDAPAVIALGAAEMLCALAAVFALTQAFAVRLQRFSDGLCRYLEMMLDGTEELPPRDSEALFDRIVQRATRLYRAQQAQEERLADERQALQSLVSDIAHQVRQPLAGVRMIADTLLEKPLPRNEEIAFLQRLRGESEKLHFLLEALVKTSRLETGLVQIDKQQGRIYETVAQAMGASVAAAEEKGITVTVDCPEGLVVSHDSRWTTEALANIVDNAIKYTQPGGHVALTASVRELYVELCVRDDGPGIAESEQAQVFSRFYRGGVAAGSPGVGIGLYLAREIVSRQGGYIRLRSEPGKGAAFSLMLPRT